MCYTYLCMLFIFICFVSTAHFISEHLMTNISLSLLCFVANDHLFRVSRIWNPFMCCYCESVPLLLVFPISFLSCGRHTHTQFYNHPRVSVDIHNDINDLQFAFFADCSVVAASLALLNAHKVFFTVFHIKSNPSIKSNDIAFSVLKVAAFQLLDTLGLFWCPV